MKFKSKCRPGRADIARAIAFADIDVGPPGSFQPDRLSSQPLKIAKADFVGRICEAAPSVTSWRNVIFLTFERP